MEHVTNTTLDPVVLWAALSSALAAFLLVCNAAEKVVKIWKAAKAPNSQQNDRLAALEKWREEVDGKLDRDHDRFERIDEGMQVTQRALLALLDHGLDGNNVKQMQDAKEGLRSYLINR